MIEFEKLHGLGNDFMLIDARENDFVPNQPQLQQWSDRRQGIGFDQLILLQNQGEQIRYRFFNADGTEAEQCGNGQRAIALFLYRLGEPVQDLAITGLGGEVRLTFHDQDHIDVTLQQAVGCEQKQLLGQTGCVVDVGNPHWVYVEPELARDDLAELAGEIETFFPAGVNVEAIQKVSDDHIRIRVIERGVGETRACGSGACAAAVAGAQLLNTNNQVTVSMPGGDLRVGVDLDCATIKLSGPARFVYRGLIKT